MTGLTVWDSNKEYVARLTSTRPASKFDTLTARVLL